MDDSDGVKGESDGGISDAQKNTRRQDGDLDQHVELAAERILGELSEHEREEIVEKVGENVVCRLSEDQPHSLMRRFESVVVGHVPFLHRSRAAREGMEGVAKTVFDGRSGKIIEDVGEVILDALVEEQADELVEDVIYETVKRMHKKSGEES